MAGSAARRELGGTPARVIDLASRRDDGELRALLRRSVIPGAVRIAFTREPDYFAAQALAGAEDVTVVSRHDGRLTGHRALQCKQPLPQRQRAARGLPRRVARAAGDAGVAPPVA